MTKIKVDSKITPESEVSFRWFLKHMILNKEEYNIALDFMRNNYDKYSKKELEIINSSIPGPSYYKYKRNKKTVNKIQEEISEKINTIIGANTRNICNEIIKDISKNDAFRTYMSLNEGSKTCHQILAIMGMALSTNNEQMLIRLKDYFDKLHELAMKAISKKNNKNELK